MLCSNEGSLSNGTFFRKQVSLAQDTPHNCGSGKEVVSQLDGKVRELVNKRATSSKATSLARFFATVRSKPINTCRLIRRLSQCLFGKYKYGWSALSPFHIVFQCKQLWLVNHNQQGTKQRRENKRGLSLGGSKHFCSTFATG